MTFRLRHLCSEGISSQLNPVHVLLYIWTASLVYPRMIAQVQSASIGYLISPTTQAGYEEEKFKTCRFLNSEVMALLIRRLSIMKMKLKSNDGELNG